MFLVRYLEAGRDAQRGGQRRDLAQAIAEQLPGAVVSGEPGRLIVEPAGDASQARAVLAELSGVTSFSPARRLAAADLDHAVTEVARTLPHAATFRVSVRHRHAADATRASSREHAAQLGARALAVRPDLRVDLHTPDVTIGVETRGDAAFLFTEVIAGRDWRTEEPPTPLPAGELRFVADQMLGRLATWLRLLGFDTVHPWDQPDSWVLRVARDERRVILTRDGPLARVRSTAVYFVRAREALAQVAEVVRAFDLDLDEARMFTRCTRCNTPVEAVVRAEVSARLPAAIAADTSLEIRRCPTCDQLYWRGAHVERILAQLQALSEEAP